MLFHASCSFAVSPSSLCFLPNTVISCFAVDLSAGCHTATNEYGLASKNWPLITESWHGNEIVQVARQSVRKAVKAAASVKQGVRGINKLQLVWRGSCRGGGMCNCGYGKQHAWPGRPFLCAPLEGSGLRLPRGQSSPASEQQRGHTTRRNVPPPWGQPQQLCSQLAAGRCGSKPQNRHVPTPPNSTPALARCSANSLSADSSPASLRPLPNSPTAIGNFWQSCPRQ